MKKIMMIAAAAVALFSSCSKDEQNPINPTEPGDGIAVAISFGDGGLNSRAFSIPNYIL